MLGTTDMAIDSTAIHFLYLTWWPYGGRGNLVPSRTISRTQGRGGSGTKKNPSRTTGGNLVPKGRRQCGPYINGLRYSKIHHSYPRSTTGWISSWSLELLEPADENRLL